jgi:predicted ester cyclase
MTTDSQTPAVQRALADPTLTEQERANLELVLRFRAVPFSARSEYTVAGFRPSRIGMATLAALSTDPELAYSGQSIPDRTDRILDIIVHGDRVWATWLIEGTHAGPIYGIAPTGRQVTVLELGQWRIEGGLIAEAWFFVDELALIHQLGAWDGLELPARAHPDQTKASQQW